YSMVVDELFSAPSISYDRWTPDVVSQLRDVVTDLQSVLSGGKGHLDWQAVSTVLQDLRDWLDDNDETVIGRRAHGKIARRVAKLGTVDIPPQNLQWKILNEILRICQELVAQSDSLLAKLRNMFP
ncbi:MAG: hypothetical protein RJA47_1472, partial [Actinomycetota bacterium]